MPLNIEDAGPGAPERPGTPGGRPDPEKPKRIYPWILLILLISSGVFLLFQFGVLPPGRSRTAIPAAQERAKEPPRVDTAVHVLVPAETPAPPAATPKDPGATPHSEEAGKYTIVISAFRSGIDAGEMADRWTRAGFDAGVREALGWYRVTIGRFRTVPEAREEAERWKEAFEEGYWIARADP